MYCSLSDIYPEALPEKTVAELTDDVSGSRVDELVLKGVLEDASSFIDDYLRTRYSLPIKGKQATLKDVCVDIAVYKLHKRRNRVDDGIQATYNNAKSTLEDIVSGKIALDEGDTKSRRTASAVTPRDTYYTEDSLNAFTRS